MIFSKFAELCKYYDNSGSESFHYPWKTRPAYFKWIPVSSPFSDKCSFFCLPGFALPKRHLIYLEAFKLSVSDFCYWAHCSQGPPSHRACLRRCLSADWRSTAWPKGIPCPHLHSVGVWIVSPCWLLWINCARSICPKLLCVNICFPLSWTNSEEWNCWVTWKKCCVIF